MKKQRIPLQPQQLSFSFDISCESKPVSEVENNTKQSSQTHNFNAKIISFNQAFIARKTNKDSEMYLRILESVKHIA